jgi:hypothetical protein
VGSQVNTITLNILKGYIKNVSNTNGSDSGENLKIGK